MSDFSESNRVVFATSQNHSSNLGDRLAVRVSDNAVGNFANVPIFDNIQLTASQNQFRVNENSSNGTVVGAISYSDIRRRRLCHIFVNWRSAGDDSPSTVPAF